MRPIAITALILWITCAGGTEYSVILRNTTSQMIDDGHVSYGAFKSIGGVIPPGAFKEHSGILRSVRPIPEEATVQWRTADGVMHSKTVAVRSALPADFSGSINFDIGEDEHVRVWSRPKD